MAEQRMVRENLDTLLLYDLDGPIDKAILRLTELRTHLALKSDIDPKEIRLSLERDSHDYDTQLYRVVHNRPENEAETKKRLEQEVLSKDYRRRQYEQLKKEFEGKAQ